MHSTQQFLKLLVFLPSLVACVMPLTVATPTFDTFCLPENTGREIGTVVNVVDGDTIDVRIDGVDYRVRYIGMDTPERDEPFYVQATTFNRELVEGRQVTLIKDVSETDQYGRSLRYVLIDEAFIKL